MHLGGVKFLGGLQVFDLLLHDVCGLSTLHDFFALAFFEEVWVPLSFVPVIFRFGSNRTGLVTFLRFYDLGASFLIHFGNCGSTFIFGLITGFGAAIANTTSYSICVSSETGKRFIPICLAILARLLIIWAMASSSSAPVTSLTITFTTLTISLSTSGTTLATSFLSQVFGNLWVEIGGVDVEGLVFHVLVSLLSIFLRGIGAFGHGLLLWLA